MATVKTRRAPTSESLRTFCARHGITSAEIAQRLGVSRQYVSQVLRADLSPKAVTDKRLVVLRQVITQVLWDREIPCQ